MNSSKKMTLNLSLLLIAAALLLFTMVNNQLFSSVRIDLTEAKLYTLSEGSKNIVAKIDEPINLYFFFSDSVSRDLTGLRAYAKQVEELLKEYEVASGGKLKLQLIDPEPFSEDEDRAAEFGLQSVPINNAGEELYFGLAGTNAVDDQQVIAFFQPDKQAFLEYDISKLLQNLIETKKPVVGLMSSMKIQGDIDMQTFQTIPAWMIVDQLGQLFDVQPVATDVKQIPNNIDLMVVVHPKALTDDTQYALDQFAMGGGRLLVFVDPLAENDRQASPNPMTPAPPAQPSDLNRLMSAWGIQLQQGMVLGDAQNALSVSGPNGQPIRHMTILGMTPENFSTDDVTISSLESINFSSAGIFELVANPESAIETVVTPLITSSEYAQPIPTMRMQMLRDPAELQKDFSPTGESYIVAARLSGNAKSSFDNAPGESIGTHVAATEKLNVIVVSDSDVLSDHLWVQVQNFFGQRVASPFANNGDFVTNAVENLVGSSELINIRSRGQFSRPFSVVQDLKREAESRYLQSANDLQAELAATESKLTELQSSPSEQGVMTLSAEQEVALAEFQQQKLRIRKQLREVRRQLDQDIETLGSTLKFLNIALIPILLTLMLLMFSYVRSGRASNES